MYETAGCFDTDELFGQAHLRMQKHRAMVVPPLDLIPHTPSLCRKPDRNGPSCTPVPATPPLRETIAATQPL